MKQNPALPSLTRTCLDAYVASAWFALMWLGRVIFRLGAPRRSQRLQTLVSQLERAVESILFLEAIHRFGPPPQHRRIPPVAPPGFRRQRKARRRLFFRNARVRARKASLAQRVTSLVAALAGGERHVAYFYTRLLRGLRGARLIAVAPSGVPLNIPAPRAVIAADTS